MTDEKENNNEEINKNEFSILKVYLENKAIKSFKYDKNTVVKDVLYCLKDKLTLNIIEYFGIVVRLLNEDDCVSKYILINETQHLFKLKEQFGNNCIYMLRFIFIPENYKELIENDINAFNYLYSQSLNDVLTDKFGSEIKYEMILHLSTLSILYEHYNSARNFSKSLSFESLLNSESTIPRINLDFLQ